MEFPPFPQVCPTCGARVIALTTGQASSTETITFACDGSWKRTWKPQFKPYKSEMDGEFAVYEYGGWYKEALCKNAERVVELLRKQFLK